LADPIARNSNDGPEWPVIGHTRHVQKPPARLPSGQAFAPDVAVPVTEELPVRVLKAKIRHFD